MDHYQKNHPHFIKFLKYLIVKLIFQNELNDVQYVEQKMKSSLDFYYWIEESTDI